AAERRAALRAIFKYPSHYLMIRVAGNDRYAVHSGNSIPQCWGAAEDWTEKLCELGMRWTGSGDHWRSFTYRDERSGLAYWIVMQVEQCPPDIYSARFGRRMLIHLGAGHGIN